MRDCDAIDELLAHLTTKKEQLLQSLHEYNKNDDLELKFSILKLINSFQDELSYIVREFEFQYDINLEKVYRANDELVGLVVEIKKAKTFISNFKQNFILKQFSNDAALLESLSEERENKYVKPKSKSVEEGAEKAPDAEKEAEKELSTDAKLLKTNKKITNKLIESSQLLQSSLLQSSLNLEELEIQGDSLEYLSEKYGSMKVILEKSDSFIKDLKASTDRDKKRMYYALAFFGLCVLNVFWRRLFKLPVMILFKSFAYSLKLIFAVIFAAKSKNSEVVSAGSKVAVTTVAPSTTTTAEVLDIETEFATSYLTESASQRELEDSAEQDLGDKLGRIIDEL